MLDLFLEYCDSMWHSSLTAGQSKSLEQLQRRACRIVLGRNFTSYSDALIDCDLDSLYDRRVEHCLRFAEGLSKSSRRNELLPPVRRDVHGRNLRNADKLTQLFARTLWFQNSLIPYCIRLLNEQLFPDPCPCLSCCSSLSLCVPFCCFYIVI